MMVGNDFAQIAQFGEDGEWVGELLRIQVARQVSYQRNYQYEVDKAEVCREVR